jgi:hypothetical protein
MGCSREKRKSEKTLDEIFSLIRSLDVEIWTGEKYRVEDVEENVILIKQRLDTMLQEFKQEVGYNGTPTKKVESNAKPWVDPVYVRKEWNVTPIIPEKKE